MHAIKSLLLLGAIGATAPASAICYQAKVTPRTVVGLKQTATLTFVAPEREPGYILINARGLRATNQVDVVPGQPIRYLLGGDSGSFVQGSQDGATTLNIDEGIFAIKDDHEGEYLVYVKRSSAKRPIASRSYLLTTISDAACKLILPD